ncbi:hypothetical protein EI94DRAFT_1818161 [Lactarius quietus]|nr:hypothetical protein EI94DRAFT_1818161 [Lactarius quietus]
MPRASLASFLVSLFFLVTLLIFPSHAGTRFQVCALRGEIAGRRLGPQNGSTMSLTALSLTTNSHPDGPPQLSPPTLTAIAPPQLRRHRAPTRTSQKLPRTPWCTMPKEPEHGWDVAIHELKGRVVLGVARVIAVLVGPKCALEEVGGLCVRVLVRAHAHLEFASVGSASGASQAVIEFEHLRR